MKSLRNTVSLSVFFIMLHGSLCAMQESVHPVLPVVEQVAQVARLAVQAVKKRAQQVCQLARPAMKKAGERIQELAQRAKPMFTRVGKTVGIGSAAGGAGALGANAYHAATSAHEAVAPSVVAVVASEPAMVAVAKKSVVDQIASSLPFSESVNKKIIVTVPKACAYTAAAAGAGTLGYYAAHVAGQSALHACAVGTAMTAAGVTGLATVGAPKTALLAAATACGWIMHNGAELKNFLHKWSVNERALSEERQFFRWELHRWPTAQSLRDNELAVITQLRTDIASANGSFNIVHELVPGENPRATQVTWKDVLRYIQHELDTLVADRRYVEDTYLTWLDFCPAVYAGSGIKSRYSAACKSAGVTEITPGEYQDAQYWTAAQHAALDGNLPQTLFWPTSFVGKVSQWIFKPNFASAAQLWWSLKSLQSRLEELESFVKKLGANTVSAPLPPYCACGRWGQPGARGCHHEQVGNPAGFCEACAPRPVGRR